MSRDLVGCRGHKVRTRRIFWKNRNGMSFRHYQHLTYYFLLQLIIFDHFVVGFKCFDDGDWIIMPTQLIHNVNSMHLQQKEQQQQKFRSLVLPLLTNVVQTQQLPLCTIQIVLECLTYLQVLKFPIDYYSVYWFGQSVYIFSYMDLSYYFYEFQQTTTQAILVAFMLIVSIYWTSTLALFLAKINKLLLSLRRLIMIIISTVLFMPLIRGILIAGFAGMKYSAIKIPIKSFPLGGSILGLVTLSIFVLLINFQVLLKFQFLKGGLYYKRLRNSSCSSVVLVDYILLNQLVYITIGESVASLIILDLSLIGMSVVFITKNEHHKQNMKLLQMNFIVLSIIATVILNLRYFMSVNIGLSLFFIIALISFASIQQLNIFSLSYELEYINKWTTSRMKMRHTSKLRSLLRRKDEHHILTYIYGYNEVHRQKCDNLDCPITIKYMQSQAEGQTQQLAVQMIQSLVNQIYLLGCKSVPIDPQLKLEYSIFLYEIHQNQAALKNLLLISESQLNLDNYYRYSVLKQRIYRQMMQQPDRQFLDLMSELEVSRKQKQIMAMFQQAALINLQFWSVLNEEYPDSQKLNEIGSARVKIGTKIKLLYQEISNYVYSQRITYFIANYLMNIDNDEDLLANVVEKVKAKYQLQNKIIIQDWMNSSSPILLFSYEANQPKIIININTTCTKLLGYQKHQIIGRPLDAFFLPTLPNHIDSFIQTNSKRNSFYLAHKNGYTIQVQRTSKIQNSMRAGITSICTIEQCRRSPKICFIIFDSQHKVIGLSSSCIALLGIDLKLVEEGCNLEKLLKLTHKQLQQIDNNNPKALLMDRIFRMEELGHMNGQNRIFIMRYDNEFKGQFVVHFSLLSQKGINNQLDTQPLIKIYFQFHINTDRKTVGYVGINNKNNFYQIPSLKEFHHQNIEKQKVNYAEKITVLRMVDNIIQVIEYDQEEGLQKCNQMMQEESETEQIARKDRQQIFGSKETFQNFLQSYQVNVSLKYVLFGGVVIILVVYIVFFTLYDGHYNVTNLYFQEVTFQSLKLGIIAKEFSYLLTMDQMKAGKSNRVVTNLITEHAANLERLQQIKDWGSKPFQIELYLLNDVKRTYYTDEYILTFIRNMQNLHISIQTATTQAQLAANYEAQEKGLVDYLKLNGNITNQLLVRILVKRIGELSQEISIMRNTEIAMLCSGLLLVIFYGTILMVETYRSIQQKINILKIFLSVSQQQIQAFSERTELFLLSLHIEEGAGDIEASFQPQNKKKNNSVFAKKKRFKSIKLSKSIYLRLLVIPLLAQAFFIHSFIEANQHFSFMENLFQYATLTARADFVFYTNLAAVQKAIMNQQPLSTNVVAFNLNYYREYFVSHYKTVGNAEKFHSFFTKVFKKNICEPKDPIIPISCEMPLLSVNGTLMFFNDLNTKTQLSNYSSDFPQNYYLNYEVISEAHRMLSERVLSIQEQMKDQDTGTMLNTLIIWGLLLVCLSILYGIPTLKSFIQNLNINKKMLLLIPVSMASSLPRISKYINRILKSKKCC